MVTYFAVVTYHTAIHSSGHLHEAGSAATAESVGSQLDVYNTR